MMTAHEMYLAVRPHTSGTKRDLRVQPGGNDVRVYLRAHSAWRFINEWKAALANHPDPANAHPGYVLELHLDQLFECEEHALNIQDPERRLAFHERMFQNHAAWATAYQDDRPSTLLDENDLEVLRRAASLWLSGLCSTPAHAVDGSTCHSLRYECANPRNPVEKGLASVLRALTSAGKLGGSR